MNKLALALILLIGQADRGVNVTLLDNAGDSDVQHGQLHTSICHNAKCEPMDVPAVEVIDHKDDWYYMKTYDVPEQEEMFRGDRKRWTCADKSRILLTAEDGTKHCVKFDQEK